MARKSSFQIGVINITMHPNSPEKYIALFNDVFRNKGITKIRGAEWGMLGSFREGFGLDESENYYIGDFYKFLNIDPHEKWLDFDQLKTIDPSDDDGRPLPVPENIKPNLKEIPFIFFPNKHRLIFECAISNSSLLKLMDGLFTRRSIRREYGQVDLTAEASKELIKKIISLPRLTKLNIKFNRPNGDDFADKEKIFLNRMEKQNIRNFNQVSTTRDPEGIKPDDETIAVMNVAKSNGHVRAEGYDDGKSKIFYSTEEHPVVNTVKYSPEIETKLDAMVVAATSLLKTL